MRAERTVAPRSSPRRASSVAGPGRRGREAVCDPARRGAEPGQILSRRRVEGDRDRVRRDPPRRRRSSSWPTSTSRCSPRSPGAAANGCGSCPASWPSAHWARGARRPARYGSGRRAAAPDDDGVRSARGGRRRRLRADADPRARGSDTEAGYGNHSQHSVPAPVRAGGDDFAVAGVEHRGAHEGPSSGAPERGLAARRAPDARRPGRPRVSTAHMPVDNALYDRLSATWWDDGSFLGFLRLGVNPARFGYFRQVLDAVSIDPRGPEGA